MIVRTAPVLAHGLRFDDNLPLYGWLEDIDFARSIAPYGRVVKSMLLRGVHLGVKRGRTSGVKLGYSQIANPLYMLRKGTFAALMLSDKWVEMSHATAHGLSFRSLGSTAAGD